MITHRKVKNRVGVAWVFPGLWQHPVVPVDVVGVEAELPSFQVLLDRSSDFMLKIHTKHTTIIRSDCRPACRVYKYKYYYLYMVCMAEGKGDTHGGHLHLSRCLLRNLAHIIKYTRGTAEKRYVVPRGHHLLCGSDRTGRQFDANISNAAKQIH